MLEDSLHLRAWTVGGDSGRHSSRIVCICLRGLWEVVRAIMLEDSPHLLAWTSLHLLAWTVGPDQSSMSMYSAAAKASWPRNCSGSVASSPWWSPC